MGKADDEDPGRADSPFFYKELENLRHRFRFAPAGRRVHQKIRLPLPVPDHIQKIFRGNLPEA